MDVVYVVGLFTYLAFFLVLAKLRSSWEDCKASLALPLRLQNADLPSLIFAVLSGSVLPERFIRGKPFLAEGAPEGFVVLLLLGLLLLGLPLLGVLLPHMLIEVLAIHEGRGTVPATKFVIVILLLPSEQYLFVPLSGCLL